MNETYSVQIYSICSKSVKMECFIIKALESWYPIYSLFSFGCNLKILIHIAVYL